MRKEKPNSDPPNIEDHALYPQFAIRDPKFHWNLSFAQALNLATVTPLVKLSFLFLCLALVPVLTRAEVRRLNRLAWVTRLLGRVLPDPVRFPLPIYIARRRAMARTPKPQLRAA